MTVNEIISKLLYLQCLELLVYTWLYAGLFLASHVVCDARDTSLPYCGMCACALSGDPLPVTLTACLLCE